MPKVNFEEILPYSAPDLYDLVMDVERYPDIFNDISGVRARDTGPHSKNVDVTVTALFMSLSYNCDVTGIPQSQIDIKALSGDFESMEARWLFETQADGRTKVRYDMDFDFGGMGFKNAAAMAFIQDGVEDTRRMLGAYAARHLETVPDRQGPSAGGAGPAP